MTQENFAMIEGVKYPIDFGGYDRATYKHVKGCLAENQFGSGPCICGAIDRADKWYVVKVPASAQGKSESQK